MGIWIRRQDGGLGKYTKFLPPIINREETIDPEVPFCTINGKILSIQIMGCDMNGRVDVLGAYTSEAEAIQVLDMIQKAIKVIAKHPGCDPVFQMPEARLSDG